MTNHITYIHIYIYIYIYMTNHIIHTYIYIYMYNHISTAKQHSFVHLVPSLSHLGGTKWMFCWLNFSVQQCQDPTDPAERNWSSDPFDAKVGTKACHLLPMSATYPSPPITSHWITSWRCPANAISVDGNVVNTFQNLRLSCKMTLFQ